MEKNFIHEEFLEDISVCDKLIDYFERNPNKREGSTYGTKNNRATIDKKQKDSIDCSLELCDVRYEYTKNLKKIVENYIEKFPMCNIYSPWAISKNVNIQKYNPGGGFHRWHTERVGCENPYIVSRHLVFMTYLNDVTDGGGTEFFHQNFITKPKKGLTLIWPADWTYTHRGQVSPSQTKYIVTGWFNYTK